MPFGRLTGPGLALTIVFAVLVAACGRTASPWEDGITTEYGCDNGSTLVIESRNDLVRWRIDDQDWVEEDAEFSIEIVQAKVRALKSCPGFIASAIEEPVPGLDLFELPEPD
jgi:hypothetical protein